LQYSFQTREVNRNIRSYVHPFEGRMRAGELAWAWEGRVLVMQACSRHQELDQSRANHITKHLGCCHVWGHGRAGGAGTLDSVRVCCLCAVAPRHSARTTYSIRAAGRNASEKIVRQCASSWCTVSAVSTVCFATSRLIVLLMSGIRLRRPLPHAFTVVRDTLI
jgi:hypothetical protein